MFIFSIFCIVMFTYSNFYKLKRRYYNGEMRMTQTTTTNRLWGDDMDHLSGIATISTQIKDGLGALHLRLQIEGEEIRFMFSGLDFSRLISGKMIRGFERDNFDEEAYPIIAKRLGDYAVFEVYGVHSFFCRFENLKALWSFTDPLVLISGSSRMPRTNIIIDIGRRAMHGFYPADIYPCKTTARA